MRQKLEELERRAILKTLRETSSDKLAAARERQSDAQVFELQDAGFFHPERSEGNRVEARGFLTKQPGGGKLFVTSIQTIGERCPTGG